MEEVVQDQPPVMASSINEKEASSVQAKESEDVMSDGKNAKQIKCQRCPSTILVPGTASLVTHEFLLPEAPPKEGEEKPFNDKANKYWCVDNMYAFENVGFSKTVEGVKYLICADCEIGPIGWHDLNTKLSYVSVCKTNSCL